MSYPLSMGRRVRTAGFLLLALGAALAVPAGAIASPADVAATRTYIQANYALVQAGASRLPTSIAAYHGVLGQVRRECPTAAAASPQDEESTQLSNEVIGAMVLAAGRPDLPAIHTFIRVAGGLRWSSRALTNAVHGYVNQLKAVSALASPNLCGDVKAWAASGFHALPASTVRFDAVFMPNWVALGLLPAQLTAYERPEERALLSRSNQLEMRLTNAEAAAVETWGEIMNELVLNP